MERTDALVRAFQQLPEIVPLTGVKIAIKRKSTHYVALAIGNGIHGSECHMPGENKGRGQRKGETDDQAMLM
jgi:hypothetical protein